MNASWLKGRRRAPMFSPGKSGFSFMTVANIANRWSIAACAILGVSSLAVADPGDHIRVGDATITPSLDLGLEYRTNPLRLEANSIPGVNMRIAPRVEMTLESQEVDMRLGGDYQLIKFFSERLTNLDRFNQFNVDVGIDVLKDQVIGFRFADNVGIDSNPSGDQTGSYHTQFRNRFDGASVIRVGPTLAFTLGGFYRVDSYRVPEVFDDTGRLRAFNFRDSYGPTWSADWTFFPRTAVVYYGSYDIQRWGATCISTGNAQQALGSSLALPDNNHLKMQAGLRGRITERMTVVVTGGYGSGRYLEDSVDGCEDSNAEAYAQDVKGIDHLLVTTQIQYDFGVGQRVAVGYRKDFLDSWFTNYTSFNELYGTYTGRMGSRFGLSSGVRMRFENHFGQESRADIRLQANGDLTYYFQDYASVTAGAAWIQRATSDVVDQSLEFDDVNIHLLGTFTY